jgi:hypothetical protein
MTTFTIPTTTSSLKPVAWIITDQVVTETGLILTLANGMKVWLDKDGQRHRDGGPAQVHKCGTGEWYQHGKLHRDDGPAFEFHDGLKMWYQRGVLHRLAGPAVEYASGHKEYRVHGRKLTEDEFYRYVDHLTGEVFVPPGRKLANEKLFASLPY